MNADLNEYEELLEKFMTKRSVKKADIIEYGMLDSSRIEVERITAEMVRNRGMSRGMGY